MKHATSVYLAVFACALSIAWFVYGHNTHAGAYSAGSPSPCCFANDHYESICKVAPGEGETCENILEYLNNPMSTGKAYCGGTSVRGGWVRVDCKTGKPSTLQNSNACMYELK